ncbi:carboxymuconolactone decarboxylase family protein [Echinicola strongylocentroti]|uniref:Carboxymuconolactone decarboxylase family protein n=1 Tax=Echinicola strongylocentroti TaxID=1795355 RepID=A0A2Z4INM5_9BACT|nr:carboxymuconolactone decarboxylase family protein [Echinicola strongylocentroti]AWW32377.1 carboxymuconolactone decarboxylase family protein [Echinicola strongylocentroti]
MKERIAQKDLPKGLYESLKQTQNYLDKNGLPPTLKGLIKMRVSQINSCAYCIDMHYKEAIHAGDSPLRLISLTAWRETPYYSAKEQAVLEFAELLTHMPSEQQSDAIHDKLKKHFSQAEIAMLTLEVIQINSWNRMVRSFGLVPGNYKVQES